MSSRKTMNVSLTEHLERFVVSQVKTGQYRSASEVVRDGLRALQERKRERKAALSHVRASVAQGLAEARRGELSDGEAFFDELEREEAERPPPIPNPNGIKPLRTITIAVVHPDRTAGR